MTTPEQKKNNRRMGLTLASIALLFFSRPKLEEWKFAAEALALGGLVWGANALWDRSRARKALGASAPVASSLSADRRDE